MASMGMQMAGCVLALVGWIGVIVVCIAPMWRVSAFIGASIVTSQIIWEGIWMSCVVQSTGQMQCKVYDSMLALGTDIQGARALMVVSIITGIVGLLIAFAGGKCTNFIREKKAKARASVAAGAVLIISGFLCLIPVSWTASVIIRDFYNPLLVDAQKRELGASLYIGWGAGALLVLGGALLCATCPSKEDEKPPEKYLLNRFGGQSKEGSLRTSTPPKTYIRSVLFQGVRESAHCPMALQELGISLSMVGVAGTILICALPMWKVTAFIGTHLVVMQVFWEGLWMTCVSEYTGQLQCKLYDALLDLSPDLQAARGLICISLVLGCLGFLIFLLGARCTNCLSHPGIKAHVVLSSGAIFCLASLTTVVAVSWTANSIISDFHNPRVPEVLKRELGAAIYIGFVTSGLLFCGGAVLCTSCPPQRARVPTHSSYAIKIYV
ncbi:claudin-3-like [Trachinotus anak]|uniref:claudin-3-like n=1 Tax=Trachinotus anak TaxID=443729 RepID=UPI0039F20006